MNHNQETPPSSEELPMSESVAATHRLLELVAAMDKQALQDSQIPPVNFDPPPGVKKSLEQKQAEYERAWETQDAKSTPQTGEQIRVKVIKQGHNLPLTAEEVERNDIQELQEKRAEATSRAEPKPAKKHHKPRTRYVSPRDTGPPDHIARQMRGEQ